MPSVLICDDSLFARQMTRRMLTGAGFDVVGEAEDGEQAVERFRELKPDLLLLDLVMPRVGGAEAIRRIKAENPDARIVVCSAMGQDALVGEAMTAGALGFVVKPAKPDALRKVAGDALS